MEPGAGCDRGSGASPHVRSSTRSCSLADGSSADKVGTSRGVFADARPAAGQSKGVGVVSR